MCRIEGWDIQATSRCAGYSRTYFLLEVTSDNSLQNKEDSASVKTEEIDGTYT